MYLFPWLPYYYDRHNLGWSGSCFFVFILAGILVDIDSLLHAIQQGRNLPIPKEVGHSAKIEFYH